MICMIVCICKNPNWFPGNEIYFRCNWFIGKQLIRLSKFVTVVVVGGGGDVNKIDVNRACNCKINSKFVYLQLNIIQ